MGKLESLLLMAENMDREQLQIVSSKIIQLLKGDILYAGENYAQAADTYESLINAHNETLRTVAILSLAAMPPHPPRITN